MITIGACITSTIPLKSRYEYRVRYAFLYTSICLENKFVTVCGKGHAILKLVELFSLALQNFADPQS